MVTNFSSFCSSFCLSCSEPTVWDGDASHLGTLRTSLSFWFRAHRVGWRRGYFWAICYQVSMFRAHRVGWRHMRLRSCLPLWFAFRAHRVGWRHENLANISPRASLLFVPSPPCGMETKVRRETPMAPRQHRSEPTVWDGNSSVRGS